MAAMKRTPSLLLRAIAALLSYPDAELRAALPEIAEVIQKTRFLNKQCKQKLVALAEDIAALDSIEAEIRYVELFDHGRATSLNLFEHVYSDGRERGPAMLELRQRYLDAGMVQSGNELPDHLPLLLEYLSCRGKAETRETLSEIAPILRSVGNTLLSRHSPYAAAMASLLEIGKEKGLDPEMPAPPPEDIDSEYQDKPAFSPPEPQYPRTTA